jgi:hypothetical protein
MTSFRWATCGKPGSRVRFRVNAVSNFVRSAVAKFPSFSGRRSGFDVKVDSVFWGSCPSFWGSVAKPFRIRRNGSNEIGSRVVTDFKGRHFGGEIVLWAVRWYCRYGISYRGLEQMMAERGAPVDHTTIYRWVQKYAPRSRSGCAGNGVARVRQAGGSTRPM